MQRKRTSCSIPIRRLRCRSCWSSHDERDHPAGTPPSRLIAGGEIRRCPRLGVRRHRAPEPGRFPLCIQAPRTPPGARCRCHHANGLCRDVSLHRSLRRGASRGCDHTARLAAERHGRTRRRRSHDPRLVLHLLPTPPPLLSPLPPVPPPPPAKNPPAVPGGFRAEGWASTPSARVSNFFSNPSTATRTTSSTHSPEPPLSLSKLDHPPCLSSPTPT